ncbi:MULTISPECIES: hypothetical protein [unclassified Sphingobium]|nr:MULTISPECIES: hypothetical protein [unclassified Sphingobium]PSO11885.1 hypothetical protein C7E20_10585 [Sphingobium sp. AEW4]
MIGMVRHYAALFSAGDREGWLALFVEAPLITEPAHAAPCEGRAPLEQAFDRTRASGTCVALESRHPAIRNVYGRV